MRRKPTLNVLLALRKGGLTIRDMAVLFRLHPNAILALMRDRMAHSPDVSAERTERKHGTHRTSMSSHSQCRQSNTVESVALAPKTDFASEEALTCPHRATDCGPVDDSPS